MKPTKSRGNVMVATIRLRGISSRDAHEAAKAAGAPIIEVMAGYRTPDNTFEFGGMQFRSGASSPVTGTLPGSWFDFLNSQKTKRGRPRKRIEINVAMCLSSLYFHVHTGCGIQKARILAAQRIVPGTDPEAAEQKYHRASKAIRKSGVLKDFDRVFEVPDTWVLAAHKTAIVDVQAGGVQLSGEFWIVQIGSNSAEHLQIDHFLARVDVNG